MKKKYLIFAAAVVTAISGYASDISQSAATPVLVTVESEVKDLAKGYAAAFAQLSRPPITITLQKEGSTRVLEDVRSVRASEGVLIVEVGRGLLYLVNPRDIVWITDGQTTKPK